MHELSIAQSVIEIVEDNIKSQPSSKVRTVFMKVGKMSNVLVDSLVFGFDSLISGTELEGAKLEVEEIPLKIKCNECLAETELERFTFMCTKCKSTKVEIISGNELTVSEIELE